MAGSDVDQLTAELSGLRAALRERAIIEQATGLLAGRIGCGLSAAFNHLTAIAGELDIPVDEAAYLLLSQTSPEEFPDRLPGTTAAVHALFDAVALRSPPRSRRVRCRSRARPSATARVWKRSPTSCR